MAAREQPAGTARTDRPAATARLARVIPASLRLVGSAAGRPSARAATAAPEASARQADRPAPWGAGARPAVTEAFPPIRAAQAARARTERPVPTATTARVAPAEAPASSGPETAAPTA